MMGIIVKLAHAKKKIKELEAELAELKQPSGIERPSPQGAVGFDVLDFQPDRITIQHSNLIPLGLTGSDSMDPLFDKGDILLGTEDFDKGKLIVGDIVSYHAGSGRYITHRIVDISQDEKGCLYRLKGDNNNRIDSYLVRDEHIKYYVTGIIYVKK